jgi:hypothetical protein
MNRLDMDGAPGGTISAPIEHVTLGGSQFQAITDLAGISLQAGTYFFYLWTGALNNGTSPDIANSGVMSELYQVTVTTGGGGGGSNTISGTILEDTNDPADGIGDVPLQGALVSASSGQSAMTDASGNYTINNVPDGNVTVTPSKTGQTFTPGNANVSVPPNATGVDFVSHAGGGGGPSGDLNYNVHVEQCQVAPVPPGDPGTWTPLTGIAVDLFSDDAVTLLDTQISDAAGDLTFAGLEGDENHGGGPGQTGYQYFVRPQNPIPPSGDQWFIDELQPFMFDADQSGKLQDVNFKFTP